MIKHDIGHLHCPYFEEIYDSGLHLLLIPRKSQLKSASITICRGGLQHEREIASSKIPFGTAYYLSQAILSPDFKNELKKDGISASLSFDYSYTIYQLDTVNDLYKGVAKLMKRIAKACYKEDDVTSIWEREKKTPSSLEIAQKKVLEGLYTASPIRYGVKPNSEEGKRIHASALKKYQDAYGELPNQFAADGYDTMYVIYEVFKASGLTTDLSAEELCDAMVAAITGDFSYDGLTGQEMTWSTDGTVSKDPVVVVIKNGQYEDM